MENGEKERQICCSLQMEMLLDNGNTEDIGKAFDSQTKGLDHLLNVTGRESHIVHITCLSFEKGMCLFFVN